MTRSVPAGTPQHLRSWMGRRAQRSRRIGVVLVALVAVIATSWSGTALAADHSHATIRVSVGGDRSGLTTVLGLQGVVLSLYEGQQSPTDKVEGEWATCTSDSSGLCEFEVPIAEVDKNFRPWVVQESAPTGWYIVFCQGVVGRFVVVIPAVLDGFWAVSSVVVRSAWARR